MTIGEKIYKLRSDKGISQETMAFDLGVSRQAVSKWETDQSLPDLDKIKAISEYFNISIDSLVQETKEVTYEECQKEEIDIQENKYDANKIKRTVLIMLKTAISLSVLYVIAYLLTVIFQKKLDFTSLPVEKLPFVFPLVDFIKRMINTVFIIVTSIIMLKRVKNSTKRTLFEIIVFICYIIGIEILLNSFLLRIENDYIARLIFKDSFSQMIYVKLVAELSKYNLYTYISLILLQVSLIIMLIVKKFNNKKYELPKDIKEYKTLDSVLSFLNGLFLGIPGLLFQIIWLLDARSDNQFRFKKMRFWYIWGFVLSIVLSIIILLIEIF